MKISNFLKTDFFGIIFTFVDYFTLNSDNDKEIWSLGLCWSLLAFIGLFGLYGLGWFFKAKNGLWWYKLSTIDLFPTIKCQNQLPNEIGHFETLCLESNGNLLGVSWVSTGSLMGVLWESAGSLLGVHWTHKIISPKSSPSALLQLSIIWILQKLSIFFYLYLWVFTMHICWLVTSVSFWHLEMRPPN